jgi:hypothetical protein
MSSQSWCQGVDIHCYPIQSIKKKGAMMQMVRFGEKAIIMKRLKLPFVRHLGLFHSGLLLCKGICRECDVCKDTLIVKVMKKEERNGFWKKHVGLVGV